MRTVTAADEAFLYRVYAHTRQEELAQVDWTQEVKEAFLRMQFEAQQRYYTEYYPGAQFQVIQLADQPIGRLYLHCQQKEIRIMDISLLPEYRNRGIGSTLLQGVMQQARQAGLPVTIHVERFNPALRLYAWLGFHLVEDRGVYYFLEWLPAGAEAIAHAR